MTVAFEKLLQHLDENDVLYRRYAEREAVEAYLRVPDGVYRFVAWVDVEDSLFQVFGCAPIRVPEGCRPAVAETIIRANSGLKVGKFELDFAEGVIRFHVAHILCGDMLDDGLFGTVFSTALSMLSRYTPAILSVVYGNEAPADAVRCAEVA